LGDHARSVDPSLHGEPAGAGDVGRSRGLFAVSVAAADRSRRTSSLAVAAVLAATGTVLGLLSPGTGRMPYPSWHLGLGVLTVVILAAICPQRLIRSGCVVVGLATVAFYFVPGVQLVEAGAPAASQGFYQPLLSELHAQATAVGPASNGERVEVVDSASQWAADYVAPTFALARGWDRQIDRSDCAAVQEAALVRSQPRFLRLVWQNPDWKLYRVRAARPLIQGATATATAVSTSQTC
jgi:hypothetical protein